MVDSSPYKQQSATKSAKAARQHPVLLGVSSDFVASIGSELFSFFTTSGVDDTDDAPLVLRRCIIDVEH